MKEVNLNDLKIESREERTEGTIRLTRNSLMLCSNAVKEFIGLDFTNEKRLRFKLYEHDDKLAIMLDKESSRNSFLIFKTNPKSFTSRIHSVAVIRKARKKYGIPENEKCEFKYKVEQQGENKVLFFWR